LIKTIIKIALIFGSLNTNNPLEGKTAAEHLVGQNSVIEERKEL